jgi:hypothetical protein
MIFAVQSLDAASTAVAEGLHAPIRVTRLTGDTALVAEGGLEANAGRLTVLSHASGGWTARPLLTGLPSGFDAGDQAFFGPTDVEPQGNVLFVLIGIGDSRLGEPGTHASPILSSVLEVVFSRSVAALRGDHDILAAGGQVLLRSGSEQARVRLLADVPDVIVRDGVELRSNPFDLERVGRTLYITDSARNNLLAIDACLGTQREVLSFGALPSGDEAVPTGMEAIGGQLLVALEGGFGSVNGSQIQLVNPRRGTELPVLTGINHALDVEVSNGAVHVIELSTDLASYAPGRLLRIDGPQDWTVITDDLFFPSSFTHLPSVGGWLVTQPFFGNVVLVEEGPAAPSAAN